jgi:PPOX class probable F420-dependent enzyme
MQGNDQAAARRNPIPSRPGMAADYGIAQDLDPAAWSWNWATERLAPARNYWVATTCPDGRPHTMPVWGIWQDDTLYFATSRNSRKGRNLAADPRVALHLESGDQVVILEGVVEEAHDPDLLARFVDAYEAKYAIRPSIIDPTQVIYSLRPVIAFTWAEENFPQSALRWRFE